MKLKEWQKNILSAAIVIVVGFALFLMAFLLLALITRVALVLFTGEGESKAHGLSRAALLVLTVLHLPFVFRSKLPDSLKAAYLTLPLMVALVMLGIALYGRPLWMVLVSGCAVIAAALAYLVARKKPWLYYSAVGYVAALALYVRLTGMQI